MKDESFPILWWIRKRGEPIQMSPLGYLSPTYLYMCNITTCIGDVTQMEI